MSTTHIDDAVFGSLVDALKSINEDDDEARDNEIILVLLDAGIAPASYEALWDNVDALTRVTVKA